MTQLGSTYSTAKAAIVEQLSRRGGLADVAVIGEPPVDALNLVGESGSGKAIWIADAEGDQDNVVLCGQGRLDVDETYDLTIVIQALPLDSENQADTDLKVDHMLGEVMLEMAGDPTWGLTQFVQFETSRGSFRRFVGPIGNTALRPSRCEFDLEVRARISFAP